MSLIRYNPRNGHSWSPFDSMLNLHRELDRFFGEPAGVARSDYFGGWSPALDVYDTDDAVVAKLEVPGMNKEDFSISVENGRLTISGERKSETETKGRSERYFGKFARSVTLPVAVDADKATANYNDGILTISIPKSEEARPRTISVTE